jgi:RNAse (barnase) inhibitor barstar
VKKHLSITITEIIKSDAELFEAFFGCLQFPSWFGFNWDALWDSLNDFQWDEDIEKVDIHVKSWPNLPNEDLIIFRSIMQDLDYPLVNVHLP